MKHVIRLALAALLLFLPGCAMQPGSGSGNAPVPRWQAKAIALIEVAEPAIDYLEATDADGSDADQIAQARAALAGLRAAATAGSSLASLEQMVPVYRELLIARGKDPEEVEERIFFARTLIRAVRVALA